MLCSRISINFISETLECSLISFVELLRENNDTTNHQRNIQALLTDFFNSTQNLAPPVMEDIFNARPNKPNLRNF